MSAARDIWLISFSHHNTTIEDRDRLAFSADEVDALVPDARVALGDSEFAVLSTCNRTEFYGYGGSPGWNELGRIIVARKAVSADALARPSEFRGKDAARHLFRVSASMESLALGEDQILSQVKEVHRQILGHAEKSPVLDRLYQFAIRAGKRVRTETTLCDGAVSIASASVELSKRIFGDLGSLEIALVGAGETAETAAEHFKAAGATRFVVVNRSAERGKALADRFGGTYRPMGQLADVLGSADVAVFATGSADQLVDKRAMKTVMKQRGFRSLFLIDISNPRNIDPAVSKLSGVFLYNIDDLDAVIKDNLKSRQKEIPAAEAIIEELVEEWDAWMQTIRVRPTIGSLARFFQSVRDDELERYADRYTDEQREAVDAFSRGLVKKLLHNPIMFLRQSVENGTLKPEDVDLVRRLFDLDSLDDD